MRFFIFLLLASLGAHGQNQTLHVFAGGSNYQGDLKDNIFSTVGFGRAFGAIYRNQFSNLFAVRLGVATGLIMGDDAKTGKPSRNLKFMSYLYDGYGAIEFRLWNHDRFKVVPYSYAGMGVFHFNPFVHYGDKNQRVFLQPLGTEGQGLPQYPDRKMYNTTQVFIPIGGGLLYPLGEKWLLGVEARFNKTFTDYLDDVSTRYARPDVLLQGRGQLAVDLAFRGDEVSNVQYPTNEPKRGNPKDKDWFYYVGITLGINIYSGNSKYLRHVRNTMGCPKW
jgi:hypothetical protein